MGRHRLTERPGRKPSEYVAASEGGQFGTGSSLIVSRKRGGELPALYGTVLQAGRPDHSYYRDMGPCLFCILSPHRLFLHCVCTAADIVMFLIPQSILSHHVYNNVNTFLTNTPDISVSDLLISNIPYLCSQSISPLRTTNQPCRAVP